MKKNLSRVQRATLERLAEGCVITESPYTWRCWLVRFYNQGNGMNYPRHVTISQDSQNRHRSIHGSILRATLESMLKQGLIEHVKMHNRYISWYIISAKGLDLIRPGARTLALLPRKALLHELSAIGQALEEG